MERQGHRVDLSRFRERCCCCYKGIEEGIRVCLCGLSFCGDHEGGHVSKTSCCISFEVRKRSRDGAEDKEGGSVQNACGELGEELEIRSDMLDVDEINNVREDIQSILRLQNRDDRIMTRDEEIDCPHICREVDGEELDLGDVGKLRCNECDVETRLWVCFTCGHIGCGRAQYGVEGNGHARRHHEDTKHSVCVLISSLSDPDGCETFCYLCDSGVRNAFVHKRLRYCGLERSPGSVSSEKRLADDTDSVVSESSPFVGITNAGNTCYVSSTLQMIGYVVSKEEFDLEMHFEVCSAENPLDCFFCQLMRVLGKMKEASQQNRTDKISIMDLVRLIWRDMSMFTRYAQHDAHEFLLFLLEKMKEGEDAYVIPPITSLFEFERGTRVLCHSCGYESAVYERTSMLCTTVKSRIRRSVEKAFEEGEYDCECGGKRKMVKFMTRLPKYLIVQVGRYFYGNDGYVKVSDKISIESLKLDKFMNRAETDKSVAERLVSEGYPRDKVVAGLRLYFNDEEKVREVLRDGDEGQRTDPKYRIAGSINHLGGNARTGHYTWWVYDKERCYLVDDSKVTNSSAEVLEDGYIFLFM